MIKMDNNGHLRMFCTVCKIEIFECMGFTNAGDFCFILLWEKGKIIGPCIIRQRCGKCELTRFIKDYVN